MSFNFALALPVTGLRGSRKITRNAVTTFKGMGTSRTERKPRGLELASEPPGIQKRGSGAKSSVFHFFDSRLGQTLTQKWPYSISHGIHHP